MFTALRHLVAASVLGALAFAGSANAQVVGGPYTNPANGHLYFLVNMSSYADFISEAAALGG